jgi:putative oxidoreductase
MMPFYQRILVSRAPQATFLIRPLVGLVFLSAGIQKFLFPAGLATVPLLALISAAIASRKLPPMLFAGNPWGTAHEARGGYSRLMGLLFLLVVEPGPFSIDRYLTKNLADTRRARS